MGEGSRVKKYNPLDRFATLSFFLSDIAVFGGVHGAGDQVSQERKLLLEGSVTAASPLNPFPPRHFSYPPNKFVFY